MKAERWWLTPVILATWEDEVGRITVLRPIGQIVCETPISKIPEQNGLEVWLKK
jgi:hypothetical protein